MADAIFTFWKPSVTATMPGSKIAYFLSEHLQIPIYHDEQIAQPWDTLYAIAGAYAFCGALPHIGKAVELAKRVVWVQNDYTIVAPKSESKAESPFRKAFRIRKQKGFADIDYWTTIPKFSKMTPYSHYVNWNSLVYNLIDESAWRQEPKESAIYYGSYRKGREPVFDKFFNMKRVAWTVSGRDKFKERYPDVELIGPIPQDRFYPFLSNHKIGLYIEDVKSSKEFHSPANRFYEMLSARLPMVFQRESKKMLEQAGIDITPFIVQTEADVLNAMENCDKIRKEQEKWHRDYRKELIGQLEEARKKCA